MPVKPVRLQTQVPDYAQRLTVARRYARWHLGDPSWANAILAAFADPDTTNEELKERGCP